MQQKEEIENEKILNKYNNYSEHILSINANEKLAEADVQKYIPKDKRTTKDAIMKNEETKEKVTKSIKSISQKEKALNLEKIKAFGAQLQKLQGASFNLSSGFPKASSADDYLESVTTRAYKTTLRVNSSDIEAGVPKQILEKQCAYQKKHDKLLELFYSMFPIDNENKENIEKALAVESLIKSLANEINQIIKQMNKDNESKKFSSIYEPMKTTILKAVYDFKEIKEKFSK